MHRNHDAECRRNRACNQRNDEYVEDESMLQGVVSLYQRPRSVFFICHVALERIALKKQLLVLARAIPSHCTFLSLYMIPTVIAIPPYVSAVIGITVVLKKFPDPF